MSEYILEVRDLKQHFPVRTGWFGTTPLKAVDGVSFGIRPGETLGLVGESGCGKTTVGRTILHLYKPTSGEVIYNGTPLTPANIDQYRKEIQIVFQDPYSSLNPRCRAGDIIREPMDLLQVGEKARRRERVFSLMEAVGLRAAQARLFPHQFSGGQRQRLTIARALVPKPKILILDDSASALDFATDARLRAALRNLQGNKTIFIVSQRTSSIQFADQILVMDDGQAVGLGTHEELLENCEIYREIYESQFKKEDLRKNGGAGNV